MQRTFGAAITTAVLFSILVFAAAGGARTATAEGFRVEEDSLVLGPVIAGRSVSAVYTFHNHSTDKVRILSAKPSCGCTVAEFDPVIQPGRSGTLRAVISTQPNQSGKLSKSIHVQTDAPGARSILLRFTVAIEQVIEARPRLKLLVTATEGHEGSGGILLRRADGVRLEVHEITADRPGLSVSTEMVEAKGSIGELRAEPGDVWLRLATAVNQPVGVVKGTIHLQTNHPRMSDLKVPYTVRVRPLMEVHPDVVRLWPATTLSMPGRYAIIGISRSDGRDFSITGVESSLPEVFSAAAAPDPGSRYQRVRVDLDDGLAKEDFMGSLDGLLTIRTDDPDKPVVTVPVIVAPTKALSRRSPRPIPANGPPAR
ncbi:MAG: DUF1573 domain-containing protein [Holophagae bacterium]|jgi:hypothetical protein